MSYNVYLIYINFLFRILLLYYSITFTVYYFSYFFSLMKIEIKSGNSISHSINGYIYKIIELIRDYCSNTDSNKNIERKDEMMQDVNLNKSKFFELTLFAKQKNSNKLVSVVEILKRKLNVVVGYKLSDYTSENIDNNNNNINNVESGFILTANIVINQLDKTHLKNLLKHENELHEKEHNSKISEIKNKKISSNIPESKNANKVSDILINNIDLF
jgi:hypothetical protein